MHNLAKAILRVVALREDSFDAEAEQESLYGGFNRGKEHFYKISLKDACIQAAQEIEPNDAESFSHILDITMRNSNNDALAWAVQKIEQPVPPKKRVLISETFSRPRGDDKRQLAMYTQFKETLGPIPPLKDVMRSGLYWLAYYDSDGRLWPAEPYQWQPHEKQWCHVGQYAKNKSLNLAGYLVVGELDRLNFPANALVVEQTESGIKVYCEV